MLQCIKELAYFHAAEHKENEHNFMLQSTKATSIIFSILCIHKCDYSTN
jgi:hypothetical protein